MDMAISIIMAVSVDNNSRTHTDQWVSLY